MDVDIYRSITNRRKFVVVPAGLSPAAIPFPDPDLANLAGFRRSHRFDPDATYRSVDAADIARQLKRQGFAVYLED